MQNKTIEELRELTIEFASMCDLAETIKTRIKECEAGDQELEWAYRDRLWDVEEKISKLKLVLKR